MESCYKSLVSKNALKNVNYCEHNHVFTLGTRRINPDPIPSHPSLNVDISVHFRGDSYPKLQCVLASLLNLVSVIEGNTAVKFYNWSKVKSTHLDFVSNGKVENLNVVSEGERSNLDVAKVQHLNKVLNDACNESSTVHGYRLENSVRLILRFENCTNIMKIGCNSFSAIFIEEVMTRNLFCLSQMTKIARLM